MAFSPVHKQASKKSTRQRMRKDSISITTVTIVGVITIVVLAIGWWKGFSVNVPLTISMFLAVCLIVICVHALEDSPNRSVSAEEFSTSRGSSWNTEVCSMTGGTSAYPSAYPPAHRIVPLQEPLKQDKAERNSVHCVPSPNTLSAFSDYGIFSGLRTGYRQYGLEHALDSSNPLSRVGYTNTSEKSQQKKVRPYSKPHCGSNGRRVSLTKSMLSEHISRYREEGLLRRIKKETYCTASSADWTVYSATLYAATSLRDSPPEWFAVDGQHLPKSASQNPNLAESNGNAAGELQSRSATSIKLKRNRSRNEEGDGCTATNQRVLTSSSFDVPSPTELYTLSANESPFSSPSIIPPFWNYEETSHSSTPMSLSPLISVPYLTYPRSPQPSTRSTIDDTEHTYFNEGFLETDALSGSAGLKDVDNGTLGHPAKETMSEIAWRSSPPPSISDGDGMGTLPTTEIRHGEDITLEIVDGTEKAVTPVPAEMQLLEERQPSKCPLKHDDATEEVRTAAEKSKKKGRVTSPALKANVVSAK